MKLVGFVLFAFCFGAAILFGFVSLCMVWEARGGDSFMISGPRAGYGHAGFLAFCAVVNACNGLIIRSTMVSRPHEGGEA